MISRACGNPDNSPRCDAAKCGVTSGLFRLLTGFSSKNEIKITPDVLKKKNGLIQILIM